MQTTFFHVPIAGRLFRLSHGPISDTVFDALINSCGANSGDFIRTVGRLIRDGHFFIWYEVVGNVGDDELIESEFSNDEIAELYNEWLEECRVRHAKKAA